ncbi:MAG: hypothetical protein E7317_02555 [Clostridiales bacterium]|nr:hypothetical protein [Clostridiales bacterium]
MKRFFSLLSVVVLLVVMAIPVLAHDKTKHNEELEYVLFRDRHYADSHPITGAIVKRLEDASYLAIDQYNGNGTTELSNLIADKIPGIPTSIADFDFSANYAHRKYTHRGWNVTYNENAHWPLRQTILKNTIRAKLFSKVETPLAWFPWLSDQLYGNENESQCEAFAVLVYYVHILGDHIEASKHTALNYVAPLSNSHDRDNPGIIPELIKYLPILFKGQTESEQYNSMIQDLQQLADTADRLYNVTGGVREEQFPEYHQCALDLLETLATYVPDLLKKEPFFHSTFFD